MFQLKEKQNLIEDFEAQILEDKKTYEQRQSMLEASRKAQEILQVELKDLRLRFQNTIEDRDAKTVS